MGDNLSDLARSWIKEHAEQEEEPLVCVYCGEPIEDDEDGFWLREGEAVHYRCYEDRRDPHTTYRPVD